MAVPSIVEMPRIDYPLHVLEEAEVWDIVKDFGAAVKRAVEVDLGEQFTHTENEIIE